MRKDLARSRDRLTRGLESIGFPVLKSQGTYFLTVDLSPLGLNETDVAILQAHRDRLQGRRDPGIGILRAGRAVTSGGALLFSKKDETLDTALERLSDAVRGRRRVGDARSIPGFASPDRRDRRGAVALAAWLAPGCAP